MRIQQGTHGAMLVVGLIMGVCGGGLLIFPVVNLGRAARTLTWQPVEAVVEGVALREDGEMRDVSAQYRFTWEGKQYGGRQVDFCNTSNGDVHRLHYEELKRRQEDEQTVTVWVNPSDPKESVIYREPDWVFLLVGLFALVFLVPGLGFGLYGLGGVLGGRRAAAVSGTEGGHLPRIAATPRGGAFVLVDAGDTWRGHGMLLVMALFWNTITWMFVAIIGGLAVKGELEGAPLVIFPLFMLPFVAVGAWLVYAWAKQAMLARRMPAGELTLPHWPLRTGDVVEASFRRRLRDARGDEELHLFDCALELHEEVRYRVGTDTRTDEATAASVALEPAESGIDREGIHARIVVPIPEEGPPSFQAPSNLLTWRLRVVMQPGGYPKDDSVFDLLVLPGAPS